MKKLLATLLSGAMFLALSVTGVATDVGLPTNKNLQKSETVAIREDVTITESIHDERFDVNAALNQLHTPTARGATWKTSGYGEWGTVGGVYGATPYGFSWQVKDDGTIPDTYHYTRTYVRLLGKNYGDSGREWGYGVVQATGSHVMDETWDIGVHTIKYGVSN